MRNEIKLHLRGFSVTLRDPGTGETLETVFAFSKSQLQAGQEVGLSSWEMIHRRARREGFEVLRIGEAQKREAVVDLDTLFKEAR